ncbi:MAG: DUF5615 family PIN-like protein [Candidatus Bathyarchaeia archaeon]
MQKPKLLLDENIGLRVYEELKNRGTVVQSVIFGGRGISDIEVIEIARRKGKIIVTMDKEFGYTCSLHKPPGIIPLRLRDPKFSNRLKAILRALDLGEKIVRLHDHIN